MTSSDIGKALREKFCLPEWAAFGELRDGTGWMAGRSIDFWAMNVFPSKGFNTVAVEIKVSRSDFLREIKDPRKRESAESCARECYFAVPKGLLSKDEVPKGWGLIEVGENGARTSLRAQQGSRPVYDETFIASVLRRACERESDLRKTEIVIDGAQIAAHDLEKWLNDKSAERYLRDKSLLEATWKKDVLAELMGEGLRTLESRLTSEFGYRSPLSFAQKVVQIVERAEAGQLEKVSGSFKTDEFKSAFRHVLKCARHLGISLEEAGQVDRRLTEEGERG